MPSLTHPPAQAGLEHKSASASPEGGLIEADDATGVVEAIVSVTGLLDEDRDVIKPGAYAKTLARRKPKGIFAHDWAKWVARTEEIVELMPGDARLPQTTKDGKPWPREAGGLYVKCRFNLETEAGRDAYSNVKFYSETGEQEWSVGYKVPPGKSTRTKSGERHIEEMDLFEYSPVLFGAATLSSTLSVKSAAAEGSQENVEDGEETGFADEVLIAQGELEDLAAGFLAGDWEANEEGKALFNLNAPPLGDPMGVFREFRNLQVPYISDEAMRDRVHAALFRLDQALIAGDRSQASAAVEIVLSQLSGPAADPVIHSFTQGPAAPLLRRAGEALRSPFMKGGSLGGKRMGVGLDRSPRANWVEKAGGLPPYIEEIAKSIHEKRGVPLDRAVPIAVAHVKKLAVSPDVDPDVRAKAAKAVAQWEALKTRAHASLAGKSEEERGEMESEHYPFLPGTYEELRELLREKAHNALSGSLPGVALVEVMGTWDDSVVVTAYGADGKAQAYEAPYRLEEEGLLLGEPAPVELKVSVGGAAEDGADLLPYPAVLEEVTVDLRALLAYPGVESKAGRVLSAVNEKRLLAAVESLVAVLHAAGLEVNAGPRVKQEDQEADLAAEAAQHQDSTAPSGRVGGKVALDPALLERGLRLLESAGAAAG